MTPPLAQAADVGQPGRRLRILAALAGIAGPVLLAAYFITPALAGWAYAAESPGKLIAYATAHRLLFYTGGWLQATGALLSIVFLLVLLQITGARRTLAGLAILTGCSVLLSVVVGQAYAARTYAELATVSADLPAGSSARRPAPWGSSPRTRGAPASDRRTNSLAVAALICSVIPGLSQLAAIGLGIGHSGRFAAPASAARRSRRRD
jgi:hypothetical protein